MHIKECFRKARLGVPVSRRGSFSRYELNITRPTLRFSRPSTAAITKSLYGNGENFATRISYTKCIYKNGRPPREFHFNFYRFGLSIEIIGHVCFKLPTNAAYNYLFPITLSNFQFRDPRRRHGTPKCSLKKCALDVLAVLRYDRAIVALFLKKVDFHSRSLSQKYNYLL